MMYAVIFRIDIYRFGAANLRYILNLLIRSLQLTNHGDCFVLSSGLHILYMYTRIGKNVICDESIFLPDFF